MAIDERDCVINIGQNLKKNYVFVLNFERFLSAGISPAPYRVQVGIIQRETHREIHFFDEKAFVCTGNSSQFYEFVRTIGSLGDP